MRCALTAVFLIASPGCTVDQSSQIDPEPVAEFEPTNPKKSGQYKRIHQGILKDLVKGRLARARQRLQAQVERDPDDPEHWFLETLVEANAGNLRSATAALRRAIELGLPPERFLAGPRNLLASMAGTEEIKNLHAEFRHRPVHGPMLGDLTGSTVKVWLRTATAAPVEVIVRRLGSAIDADPIVARGKTEAAHDFTGVVQVTDLSPQTDYTYSLRIHGGKPVTGGSFRTFPRPGKPCKLTVAFGGGAGYVPEHERMWDTIGSFDPDALLLLGDNVYIDAPRMREMQDYCYYRRQSRPEFRKLVAHTPVYTIWDDHDFGVNDCWYGPDPTRPAFKPNVFQVYRQNWANPAYGTATVPGCFYEFYLGDLYFMMLDGRLYRSDPKIAKPSMLGPQQNHWLRAKLRRAKGTFKMITSPVPWEFGAKGNSKDTWNGFRDERNAIFDFIRGAKMEGIVLLSADRHRTDIWSHPAAGHYPFPEFNSSRLTNQHVHPRMKKAEFSYNQKQSFGLLEFDTTLADPTVTMKVINIDGEVLYTKVIRRSELR